VSLLHGRKKRDRERRPATAASRSGGAHAIPAWIDREAPTGALTEIDTVEALETFRRDTGALIGSLVSRPSPAPGRNGAIVHYRVPQDQPADFRPAICLLIDSGAQYEDGTTDVPAPSRSATPTAEIARPIYRVLRGHIAIARAVFPDGTTGAQIDTLARQFLWQAGIDFDQRAPARRRQLLSVHEGRRGISKIGTTALRRGMILPTSPGYYKTMVSGIRIENWKLVIAADVPGAERPLEWHSRR